MKMNNKDFIYNLSQRISLSKNFIKIAKTAITGEQYFDSVAHEMIIENLNKENIIDFFEEVGYNNELGEYYTPESLSSLIFELSKNVETNEVYDPTFGGGSLLLPFYKKGYKVLGQEINPDTFELSNLLYDNIDLKFGDTLKEDLHYDKQFDLIISNPPYSLKWGQYEDARFPISAPKGAADWAFIQHIHYKLKDNGKAFIVLPHGVLFRSNKEKEIRKSMIKYIRSIISLPSNLFANTGIPVIILELTKQENNNMFIIDASKEFEKVKKTNKLTNENILKIAKAFNQRTDIEKYASLISFDTIEENDYNLNIPRYVDTFEEEEPIDIDAVNKELAEINIKIAEKQKLIDEMICELVYTNDK